LWISGDKDVLMPMTKRKRFAVHKDVRLPPSPCTNCGKVLDAGNAVRETKAKRPRHRVVMPDPGDFTVCIDCGHVMAFGTDLRLRDPTDDELVKVAGDPRLLAIQQARGNVMKRKAYKPDIPGPAPRTHAEFMRTFNPFNRWGVVASVEVAPGVWERRALSPQYWPPHWWWECACGDAARQKPERQV
jgi:hypothetical protein